MISREEIRMSKKLWLVRFVVLMVSILLAACAPAATPTAAPAAPSAPVQPTSAGPLPDGSSIKVGLVTDTAGVNDYSFNQLAWEGIQKASEDMGFQAKFLESKQPADYETNIDALATEGYNVIITVGSLMSDVTALKAKQYPNIKFAIIDHAYSDSGLTNVTSLMFAEDQLGFLAGVLAAGMSKSGFVCSVSSMPPPQSDRYVKSFRAGAVWQAGEANIQTMNNYINIQTTNPDIPTSTDPTQGKDTALRLIGEGCDVVFGVGGSTVKGALLAAKENNLPAIGADVDQYNLYPEVNAALLSSAQKNVDIAVYNYLKTVADGTVKAGISIGTLQNGGVGLAPFHDWDSQTPADLKAQIQNASNGMMNGSITIELP